MSSLGDVVHALPAVTDAAARGASFDWVVEEAFASIPARHPAVRTVVPIAWRRWRKNLINERAALGRFLQTLRSETYDLVVDAQGLLKSAAVTRVAHAPVRAGLSFASARESASSLFYSSRITVPGSQHAVDRLRALFAGALGYRLPEEPTRFGLEVEGQGSHPDRCLLHHGTTWPSKHWPERMWRRLAGLLTDDGWRVELPWGDRAERARAERIATGQSGVRVLDASGLEELSARIVSAGLVVGVDSGLMHLAGACDVPTVAIYGSTSERLTGCRGSRVVNLQSDLHCSPCLRQDCRYRGPDLSWDDEVVSPACYARVAPEGGREQAVQLLGREGASE